MLGVSDGAPATRLSAYLSPSSAAASAVNTAVGSLRSSRSVVVMTDDPSAARQFPRWAVLDELRRTVVVLEAVNLQDNPLRRPGKVDPSHLDPAGRWRRDGRWRGGPAAHPRGRRCQRPRRSPAARCSHISPTLAVFATALIGHASSRLLDWSRPAAVTSHRAHLDRPPICSPAASTTSRPGLAHQRVELRRRRQWDAMTTATGNWPTEMAGPPRRVVRLIGVTSPA